MMFKNNPNHNPNAPSREGLLQGSYNPAMANSFKEQELFDDFSVEVQEIEEEFWRMVLDRDAHLQVSEKKTKLLLFVSEFCQPIST